MQRHPKTGRLGDPAEVQPSTGRRLRKDARLPHTTPRALPHELGIGEGTAGGRAGRPLATSGAAGLGPCETLASGNTNAKRELGAPVTKPHRWERNTSLGACDCRALLCVRHTHVLGPNFQGKIPFILIF